MDIMELGAIGELVGGVAVLATLIYLATQLRQLKQQNLLVSYQHTYDSVNAFCDVVSSSDELASIIVRGRQSTSTLTPEENLRFQHVHGRLLNTVESWYFQVVQTAPGGQYRQEQLSNIEVFVRFYFDYPGVLEFWSDAKLAFNSDTNRLIEENTGSDSSKAAGA